MVSPFFLLLVAMGHCSAQPPLPPEERPSLLGTVLRLSQTGGIALDNGTTVPLAGAVRVSGAEGLQAIAPGDLVDLVQNADGLVTAIRVVPRLAQRVPLVEAAPKAVLSRFWWTRGGQEFPDSLYGADATIPLQAPAVSLESTVAYLPQDATDTAEFAVLDNAGTVLWSQVIPAGGTALLRCPLQGATVVLRCRRADGSTPDHTHCVWGQPTVLLRELGLIPLSPSVAADLAAKLEAALGGVDTGAIGLAQPAVIGLSPQMARDLQSDLLVALGRRHPVVGFMPWEATSELTDAQRKAAQDAKAAAVAVSELRYAPDGSAAKASLVHVASGEVLAGAEARVNP